MPCRSLTRHPGIDPAPLPARAELGWGSRRLPAPEREHYPQRCCSCKSDSAANAERNTESGREVRNPGQAGWHTGWLSPDDAGFKGERTWCGLRLASPCPNALQIIDDVSSTWVIFSFSSWYKAAQKTLSCMVGAFFLCSVFHLLRRAS